MAYLEKIACFILLVYFLVPEAVCQTNSVYKDMSLDEILNVDVVVTASKKPEDLFDAPLSTTIIKKEEIAQSGVTSIPEALRLAQGVIVREVTPGNYDIHIRGYDDITKNVYLTLPYNTTTLVMIDNRIVYSYFSGGTLWETFPIDLNDVERIEIVRGPASALYGSNAVTGVINIITSHAHKKGINAFVNATAGTNKAKNASANIGYNWNDKTKLTFTGNFTERHRFNTDYFDFNTRSYTPFDDLTMQIPPIKDNTTNELWSFNDFREKLDLSYDADISLRKIGGNIFFYHRFSELSNIDVAMGAQKSQSQKPGFLNMTTALSEIKSESFYFNTKMNHKDFTGQFSIVSGQDLSNYSFNSYKYINADASLEYYKQFGKLSIRPGIGYKGLYYESPIIYNETLDFNSLDFQLKDEPRVTDSYTTYMLTEWKPNAKLRFIGAIRVEKFSINKNYFTSYEIASTYRVNKNNLVRYVFSKANKSPFVFDSYLNVGMKILVNHNLDDNTSYPLPYDLTISGQEDLKFPTITSHEIGWRTQLNSKLSLDVELFHSKVNNFVNPNVYNQLKLNQHLNNMGEVDSLVSINLNGDVLFENYDLKAQQYGVGVTLNYDLTNKMNAKIYGTYQNTKISGRTEIEHIITNYQEGGLTPENTVAIEVNSIINPTQWSEKLTPAFFGGFFMNYKHSNKLNFSTDAYVYTDQEFINYNYYDLMGENGDNKLQMDIKSNIILNAKTTYRLNKNTSSYITLKNILGNHHEYGFADQIGRLLLIGIKWEL